LGRLIVSQLLTILTAKGDCILGFMILVVGCCYLLPSLGILNLGFGLHER